MKKQIKKTDVLREKGLMDWLLWKRRKYLNWLNWEGARATKLVLKKEKEKLEFCNFLLTQLTCPHLNTHTDTHIQAALATVSCLLP